MPFITKYNTKYKTIEQDIGFDQIHTMRSRFVFFEFVGLRPSTPHWIFFDGIDVTKWVNTDYDLGAWEAMDRNDDIRNPGDRYANATAFPQQKGGPSALTGPVSTDADGKLNGVFFIQSNASLSFNVGSRIMTAIDISTLNKSAALSFAQAEYKAAGEYQLYYEYQQAYQEAYQEWQDPPPPVLPPDLTPQVNTLTGTVDSLLSQIADLEDLIENQVDTNVEPEPIVEDVSEVTVTKKKKKRYKPPPPSGSAEDREGNAITRTIDKIFGTSFADTNKNGVSGEPGANDGFGWG